LNPAPSGLDSLPMTTATPAAAGPTSLALLWHFHQPCYRDILSGRVHMPWVRLHGIKDYWGMAALLEEFPGVRCAVNVVPSLLDQLEAAAAGTSPDECETLARIPAEDLSAEQRRRALEVFFYANWDRMIRVHPRYGELLEMRAPWKRSAAEAEASGDFSAADLRDLQAWFTLAWYHPLVIDRDPGLRSLVFKAREFTEDDKLYVLDRQRDVLSEVIPKYRRLAERGQVELTATPHYHPILPLLADMRAAQVAMPGVRLPAHWKPVPEDAREHLRRAVESHERRFGRRPAGCWPSEGSVSEAVLPMLAEAGFKWAATDEDILAYSLGEPLERTGAGLYRPYRAGPPGRELGVIFRDRGLSDLVGFNYHSWWDQLGAARDFITKVRGCGEGLVSVILDGENAWEHYPGGGVPFLRELYGGLSRAAERGEVVPVLPGEFLASRRGRRLERLWPGSWINHDFYIWAGHHQDQQAWDYLFRVRADLESMGAGRPAGDRQLERAWECLYAAEGSDWCWWYGDDHNSGNDDAFDELFRMHLANVYRALGRRPPDFLSQPIKSSGAGRMQATRPGGQFRATLDGRATDYHEWIRAGSYRTAAGAMDRSGPPPLVEMLFFGNDAANLYVRADFHAGRREELAAGARLTLLAGPPGKGPADAGRAPACLWTSPDRVEASGCRAALDHILEVAVPLDALGLAPGADCALGVELQLPGGAVEAIPQEGRIRFALAGPES